MKSTINAFMKINPKGKVALVGHSLGGDNIMEFVNENPQINIDITVTLDISDGMDWNDDNVPSNVNTAVNMFIRSYGQPGGTEIEAASGNKTSTILNWEFKNMSHQEIDDKKVDIIKNIMLNRYKKLEYNPKPEVMPKAIAK